MLNQRRRIGWARGVELLPQGFCGALELGHGPGGDLHGDPLGHGKGRVDSVPLYRREKLEADPTAGDEAPGDDEGA